MDNSMHNWRKAGFDVHILQKSHSNEIMKEASLPTLKIIEITTMNSITDKMLKSGPFLIIAYPKKQNLTKLGDFNIESIDKVKKFFKNIRNKEDYDIFLIPQIKGVKNGYVGVAMHAFELTYVEIYFEENVTDVRKLTRGGANLSKVYFGIYKYNRLIYNSGIPHQFLEEFNKIKELVSPLIGYFEFTKGIVNGKEDVWFVDYQNDPKYYNLLNKYN